MVLNGPICDEVLRNYSLTTPALTLNLGGSTILNPSNHSLQLISIDLVFLHGQRYLFYIL